MVGLDVRGVGKQRHSTAHFWRLNRHILRAIRAP
jgi:hypothetical protein